MSTLDTGGPLVSVSSVTAGGAGHHDEHHALRESLRDFFTRRSSEESVRYWAEQPEGFDRTVWRELAEQLGVLGLAVPETLGGAGYGWVELQIVLHEAGRSLYGGPLFSTVALGIPALLAADDIQLCRRYLPSVLSGETLLTSALPALEAKGRRTTCWARRDAEQGWRLRGTAEEVLDGGSADLVIVSADDEDGGSLYLIHTANEGVTRTALEGLDLTRRYATLTFDNVAAHRLTVGRGTSITEELADLGSLALASESLGCAERMLEMAVEYAKSRVQFDRPIGSFQAIKHLAADMLVRVESGRALVEHAAWLADNRREHLSVAASAAHILCAELSGTVTADAIHMHGGIGFTWEHPAHLYFRRARAGEVIFGDPDTYRAQLADRLAI